MMKKTSKVCAGIVLYNPDIARLQESLAAIVGQVAEVVMVDNGSINTQEITKIIENKTNISLIQFNDNLGIAKALNKICEYASKHGFKWVLTLDQDTICPEDLVERLFSATSFEKVGIVCPSVLYEGLNIEAGNEQEEVCEVKGCMTSASLTNLAIWQELGGFREDYFIDYVDNEYCKRLKVNGYRILRVNGCKMRHQLGEARTVRILFKKVTGSYHNPVRCYYMIRNNVVFIKEYKKEINVIKEWAKVVYIALGCVLYAKERRTTFRSICHGVRDAHNGKMGKYEG